MKQKNKLLTEISREEKPPPLIIKKSQVIENLEKKGSFFMPQNELLPFYPHYYENLLTKKQQHYYNINNYSLLLKNLQIEVVSEINQCYKLWQKFSPKTTLFDTWDFRLAFWQGYYHKPYFLTLKNGLETYALLPLWFEKDKDKYFWFGSWWQEENKFLVKDPFFIPLLLAVCPSPVILNAISTKELPLWIKQTIRLKPDEPKYILRLNNIKSVDDFLATFKKKKRYNLKRDKRIIEKQNPKIVFNNFHDYDTLVALSKERFAQKGEETDWQDPRRVEAFRQVIKLGQKQNHYKVRMLTIIINDKIASVDLIALYNKCYYPVKCGYDVKTFPGIGNYVNLLEIDDALKLGMEKIDFLEIGYGWKDKWFEEIPLLQYTK